MTQKEKQIKIAEILGKNDPHWACPLCGRVEATHVTFDERHGIDGCNETVRWISEPDYFNDLNACHEMEKTIPDDDTPSGTWGYIGHLVDLTGAESLDAYREAFVLAHATAAQRAEAFGLTKGLWKEGE